MVARFPSLRVVVAVSLIVMSLALASAARGSTGTPGVAMSWGSNVWNALGNPIVPSSLVLDPHQVGSATGWVTTATQSNPIAVGFTTATFAIRTDGTLWSWGDNSAGQLGDGTSSGYRAVPREVG